MTKTEAIEYLEKDIKLHELFNETKHQHNAIEALNMAIEALEQNRPTAHWKDGKWCSNCGEGIPTDVWNGGVEKDEIKFCFSCGARMESDEE